MIFTIYLFSQTLQSSLKTRQNKTCLCYNTNLSGSYLDVEVAPLIGDLEDLWPSKAVDPQPITVNQQAVSADTQHYFYPFRILQQPRDSTEALIVEEHL